MNHHVSDKFRGEIVPFCFRWHYCKWGSPLCNFVSLLSNPHQSLISANVYGNVLHFLIYISPLSLSGWREEMETYRSSAARALPMCEKVWITVSMNKPGLHMETGSKWDMTLWILHYMTRMVIIINGVNSDNCVWSVFCYSARKPRYNHVM